MRWKGRRQSQNVEDRRRVTAPRVAAGGGLGMIIVIIAVVLLGGDPKALLSGLQGNVGTQPAGPVAVDPADDELAQFISVVLADTEEVWRNIFRQSGKTYREPKLVLFRGQVRSACGFASAATGPFYCPGDEKVYIDLAFFDELGRRFQAPGDFAQAYVVAHEVAHHVQNLLGLTEHVHGQKGRVSETEYNDLSVRLELQADFLAGVWAHHAECSWQILEPGDIEEALNAASAVGDDRIQKRTRGYVVPDSFTHGTSEQRAVVPPGPGNRRPRRRRHLRHPQPLNPPKKPRISRPVDQTLEVSLPKGPHRMRKAKLIVTVCILALILILIVQNTDPVETRILFFTITLPRALLLGMTLLVGWIAGLVSAEFMDRSSKKGA